MPRHSALFLLLLWVVSPLAGQCTHTLQTPGSCDAAQSGVMFDLTAANTVTVNSFDLRLSSHLSNITFEVWAVTGGGSWVGHQGQASDWTLVGTTTIPLNGSGYRSLNMDLGLTIPAGTTQGIHIFALNSAQCIHVRWPSTTGHSVGDTVASDGNLALLTGALGNGRFRANWMDYDVLARVHYEACFQLNYSQPNPGGLDVRVAGGPANHFYMNVFSLDPANGTSPGTGFWGGLHIPFSDLGLFFTLTAPPYQGQLDASGGSFYSFPAGSLTGAAGVTIYANVHAFDLAQGFAIADVTPVVTYTLQ